MNLKKFNFVQVGVESNFVQIGVESSLEKIYIDENKLAAYFRKIVR